MAIALYTPEKETYILDSECELFKVEKVLIRETDNSVTCLYVVLLHDGCYRDIVDSHEVISFYMDEASKTITESSLYDLLFRSLLTIEGQKLVIKKLSEFGLNTILMKDGSTKSFDEYKKHVRFRGVKGDHL